MGKKKQPKINETRLRGMEVQLQYLAQVIRTEREKNETPPGIPSPPASFVERIMKGEDKAILEAIVGIGGGLGLTDLLNARIHTGLGQRLSALLLPALDGPTLEVSPDDLGDLFDQQGAKAHGRNADLTSKVSRLEQEQAEHDREHPPLTDEEKAKASTAFVSLLASGATIGFWSEENAEVLSPDGSILIVPFSKAQAQQIQPLLAATSPHSAIKDNKPLVSLLIAAYGASLDDGGCCDDCHDKSGKPCLRTQLARAKASLEMSQREAEFWEFAVDHVPSRTLRLSLAQAARLHGLPGAWFD